MAETRFVFELQPRIPDKLSRLTELGSDLSFTWNRRIRDLFANLDKDLWHQCGHNPTVFLRRVAQERLDAAADSVPFMQEYESALSGHEAYLAKQPDPRVLSALDPKRDLVAYFCAEFGIHESLPLYAGGLGILAGDHCKAASDLGLPFVAVGLLYHAGYHRQIIDTNGAQHLSYEPVVFADLPLTAVRDGSGAELQIRIDLVDRFVALRVWQCKLGHVRLFFLDSDIDANRPEDRQITRELYGGDIHTRIQQEIALGMGGLRALRAMGLAPTAWHINEGHAAFLILERMRELIRLGVVDANAALEVVAASTIFTTHTPVAAGHDVFPHDLMLHYFPNFIKESGLTREQFLALGQSPLNAHGFNQTALALRGSRIHNGVSRIHGEVASRTESYVWPQIHPRENPIDYVTNGVHVPTFLAMAWVNLFNMRFGNQWWNELHDEQYWEQIDALPDQTFWSVRQLLKFDLIDDLRRRLLVQHRRNGLGETEIKRLLRYLDPEFDICLIGFARRFATYKRATLLLTERDRLVRLLTDAERPALMIFAGKAHARDHGGQELIRALYEFSRHPDVAGRFILIEGYDLALARRLVSGVDIWLNNPEAPLEASGTSGMKAAINGVVNVSILDGWWAEGFNGENGYGIAPVSAQAGGDYRNRLEASEIMAILEDEALPRYYRRGKQGYPADWVKLAKASMKSVLPRFSSERMLLDYLRQAYEPAGLQAARLSADNFAPARRLAQWKQRVREHWSAVKLTLLHGPGPRLAAGEPMKVSVAAQLGKLEAGDVQVSLLLGPAAESESGARESTEEHILQPAGKTERGEAVFSIERPPHLSGLIAFRVRIYPWHELLTHRFEMGFMTWL